MDKPNIVTEFPNSLHAWLTEKSTQNNLPYLLAHLDDGVVWGILDKNQLKLSGDEFPEIKVELRQETLQDAKLFGPEGELFIWKRENGFAWRLILDCTKTQDFYEEIHRLWGKAEKSYRGFTLMREGAQGMLHSPPIDVETNKKIGLKIRHYIDYDSDAQAYISHSRLVDFVQVKED